MPIYDQVITIIPGEYKYLQFYHWVVSSGIACGLNHPIEWAVNAWRTPGASFDEDYYRNAREFLPRFLCEMYSDENIGFPKSADEVLKWCNDHYDKNPMCQDFFEFIRDRIEDEMAKRKKDEESKSHDNSEE